MDCTLFIPHLIPSLEHGELPWRAPGTNRLKTLLARATHTVNSATDTDAWLCSAFGIARQYDWPLAPICAAADGLNTQTGYWLRATPVHLEPQRAALILTDSAVPGISAADSKGLAQALGAHLSEENITLHATRPGCWYLNMPQAPRMQTYPLESALHRNVHEFLPQGADSLRWHRIITEMQILLHTPPSHELQEEHSYPDINSVWISSGGTLPPPARSRFGEVWSDNDVVRALARHCACSIAARKNTFDQCSGSAHLLVTIESLTMAAMSGDSGAWQNGIVALEQEFIMPLMNAMKSRRIGTISLVSANREGIQTFVLRRADLMKIWRKNKYL
jgi:hypothetical protein